MEERKEISSLVLDMVKKLASMEGIKISEAEEKFLREKIKNFHKKYPEMGSWYLTSLSLEEIENMRKTKKEEKDEKGKDEGEGYPL